MKEKIAKLIGEIEIISGQCHEELMASMDNIDEILRMMSIRQAKLEELFSVELSESDYVTLCKALIKIRDREDALLKPYRHLYNATRESILNFNKITMYLEE